MNTFVAASTLVAALGMAGTLAAGTASAADPEMVKCFGVAKAGKNDCAAGGHSCAGQATKDFDKTAFVAVPAGLCEKLAGGSTMPQK